VPIQTKSAFATQTCRGDPAGRPYIGLHTNGFSRLDLLKNIRLKSFPNKQSPPARTNPLTHTLSPSGERVLHFSARQVVHSFQKPAQADFVCMRTALADKIFDHPLTHTLSPMGREGFVLYADNRLAP
jgi:hypothetical protein